MPRCRRMRRRDGRSSTSPTISWAQRIGSHAVGYIFAAIAVPHATMRDLPVQKYLCKTAGLDISTVTISLGRRPINTSDGFPYYFNLLTTISYNKLSARASPSLDVSDAATLSGRFTLPAYARAGQHAPPRQKRPCRSFARTVEEMMMRDFSAGKPQKARDDVDLVGSQGKFLCRTTTPDGVSASKRESRFFMPRKSTASITAADRAMSVRRPSIISGMHDNTRHA